MNGVPDVGFKMKIRIHNEGVVEAVKKSSPLPAPQPAGDMTAVPRWRGVGGWKGLMVIIDSLT